jgi:TP901 family phage tail tape measure protein
MGNGLFFGSGIDKGFERDLQRMNARFNSFSKNVEKKSTVIDKSFRKISTSIGGAVSVLAIGRAGKELINFTTDLETALTEVATISDTVTQNFEATKEEIIALSTQGAPSAKVLTNALYDIVSAGNDGADAMELLTVAQQASIAGFVEVGTAADGLTTVLNAWGKSADEAANVSDIFFKTVERGKTTFPELGANIAQVAPLAASMGVSFEEISGAVATITKQGTPTAQAFTQIRSALVGMNEELGDGWSETMTLQEAFQEISDRAEGSATGIQKLVGRVEGMNAVLALTGQNAIGAAEDLDVMSNALGATADAADKVALTTEQRIQVLTNNIIAALVPLGDKASAIIGDLAERLTKAFQEGDVQRYAKTILLLSKAFAAYKVTLIATNQVMKLNNALTRLNHKANIKSVILGKQVTTANLLMAKSFKAISAAFKANPIGLLVAGLTLAIPLIEKFRDRTKEATDEQKEYNNELQRTNELREGAQSIEERVSVLPRLNRRQVQELKNAIEEQIKLEEDYTATLEEEASKRVASSLNESEVRDLFARQLVEGYKLTAEERTEIDRFQANESLRALRETNEAKLRELNSYLKKVEKELKKRPKEDEEIEELTKKEREKALKEAEIYYQERKNQLIQHNNGQESLQRSHHIKLLNNDIDYLEKKHKLTIDALERLRLEEAIINAKRERDALTPTADPIVLGDTDTRGKDTEEATESVLDSISVIDQAFSQLGDSLAANLAELSLITVEVFETFANDASSSSDKISGIVSLILEAGNIINEAIKESYATEAAELEKVNQQVATRISAEATLNRLLQDRARLELNQSAFLSANYKDAYQLALTSLRDNERTISQTLEALGQNITLTATGAGESWLGLNKVTEEYSFTLDQIINGWDDLNQIQTRGTLTNILDPVDLFGAAADSDAMIDAYENVVAGFNGALESMGKTAADMANFSQEEWLDFYTILDEGGFVVDQASKQLVNSLREAQEEYIAALEEMRQIIRDVAGSLGNALGDALVDSIQNGTDALETFKESLNDVFIEMAKAEINSLFFQGLFDTLQDEMEASMGLQGDQNWQDDLLRFYDRLPNAIENSEDFLREFDRQLQELGFEGLTGDTADEDLSTAGQIRQAITEETGTLLAGHMGAMRLSNERIANNSFDILDLAVQNLLTLNKIKENTDYLPEIAENTKKTVQRLGGI